MTAIVPGDPMVCKIAKVFMASKARPPAFRTIVASIARQTITYLAASRVGLTKCAIYAQDLIRVESGIRA